MMMFIEVNGVWDDVPVLGAYPISGNAKKSLFLSFTIQRSF